ncbi:MAG: Asp-tRNA(Asn)/Glu-tRNA(Gln) amidotransferase subunit GatB [Holosporales bacterium]|jgi:aspartyl-tRNA(Asn)/glutamyl-tRNA(Gln) amidotransferase subunit B|nr:Asp-tRNA(Asn)/Glu-tRNA(Gln) amidotransferase subunit GatB [Holosporales bacterium]
MNKLALRRIENYHFTEDQRRNLQTSGAAGFRNDGWEIVIGLEVHAQISTKSKLFSESPTDFGSDPNSQVSFYDAAMPGTLPVLNGAAVDLAIKTGLSINGTINKISQFDRKNYFYPDLPAGYQISQLYFPIISNGYIDIELADTTRSLKRINIERIHIEQDAGKSNHDLSADFSYIDLNRAGIPLMEIVSKPDMRSSTEAIQYVKKLRTILRYIETCDCNMEKGNLRIDANISIRKSGDPLGNRVEIKNINSIKFLGQALDYEAERQIAAREHGEEVAQETRLFDAGAGMTRSMRIKENFADYRYFPDPDLKHLVLTDERIDKIRRELPELPDAKKARFVEKYDLSESDATVLTEDRIMAQYFEKAVTASKFKGSSKLIANWVIGELFAFLNKTGQNIYDIKFPIEYIGELVDLILDKTISGNIAKSVFAKMVEINESPSKIVADQGLAQIRDDSLIKTIAEDIIKNNPNQVAEYKSGKKQLFGFFVGQCMKALQGKGNPEMINEILKAMLD